jgi:hypothetical protein
MRGSHARLRRGGRGLGRFTLEHAAGGIAHGPDRRLPIPRQIRRLGTARHRFQIPKPMAIADLRCYGQSSSKTLE